MIGIELQANVEKLSELIEGISGRLDDPEPLLDVVGDVIREDYKLRFESSPPSSVGGEVYGGVYWRALQEGYLLKRPDRRQGQVLIDTGDTMRAFTDKLNPNHVAEFEDSDNGFVIRVGAELDHLERLQKTWQIAVWHPLLLDKLSVAVLTWLVKGSREIEPL